MIIQILSNILDEGYLKDYTVLSPFFAGANVAFRRKTLEKVGLFDVRCYSGEDQDLSIRIAKSGEELYFTPKALVKHKNKMTLRAFLRRWFYYGRHHPYIFQKHDSKGLKIYLSGKIKKDGSIYRSLLNTRFPLHMLIFISPFLIMILILVICILLIILGFCIPALVSGLFLLVLALYYFRRDITLNNIPQSIAFIFLRFAANSALLFGGFIGGIKLKMFYISATLDHKS